MNLVAARWSLYQGEALHNVHYSSDLAGKLAEVRFNAAASSSAACKHAEPRQGVAGMSRALFSYHHAALV